MLLRSEATDGVLLHDVEAVKAKKSAMIIKKRKMFFMIG